MSPIRDQLKEIAFLGIGGGICMLSDGLVWPAILFLICGAGALGILLQPAR
jgi:hypothetical protein